MSPVAAYAQTTTITVLGDSLIAGYGLAPEAGLVPQLQKWLDNKNAEVTLLNAGVSGDTTAGGLSRINWALTPAVDAVVISLGANDMLRGLPPLDAKKNLQNMVETAKNRDLPVLLIGFQAPSNWGPDYKAAFDSIYPELSANYETVFFPSFFDPFIDRDSGRVRVELFQADGLHPNSEGVELLVEELGPYLLALSERASGS